MKENAIKFPIVEYLVIIENEHLQKLKDNFIDDDIKLEDEVLKIEACDKFSCKFDNENRQEDKYNKNGLFKHDMKKNRHKLRIKTPVWTIKL